ncbi:MAG: Rieske 2Fe-2S domain-containing protein [Cellvibrionaceae bacterium]|nr:Rieske 2Fe-2S domain-containing protein [Cellvibrionaceae bacterium]
MTKISPVLRFFHPCVLERKLKTKPIKIQIDGTPIALFRDGNNKPAAVLDRCPHRFTPLSAGAVEAGRIVCPYHGWNFDKSGCGKRPFDANEAGVTCKVPAFKVIEKNGYLWVARKDVVEEVEIGEEGWDYIGAFGFESPAPLHVVLDNFNEDEHFPFVHKILGWDAEGSRHIKHTARVENDAIHVTYSAPQRKFFGMRLVGFAPKSQFNMQWAMHFNPIRASYTASFTNAEDEDVSITHSRATIFFVPVDEYNTTIHVFLFYKPVKSWSSLVMSLTKNLFLYMARKDLESDLKLHKLVSHTPYDLKGMYLSPFDKPLQYSRALLEGVYFSDKLHRGERERTGLDGREKTPHL